MHAYKSVPNFTLNGPNSLLVPSELGRWYDQVLINGAMLSYCGHSGHCFSTRWQPSFRWVEGWTTTRRPGLSPQSLTELIATQCHPRYASRVGNGEESQWRDGRSRRNANTRMRIGWIGYAHCVHRDLRVSGGGSLWCRLSHPRGGYVNCFVDADA